MINNLYIKATPTTAAVTWGSITGTLSAQTDLQNALNAKQVTLVSGTNIKTVNSTSLLGAGDVSVGTVTSVGVTAGTGISVSGSPITSSGSITVTNSAPDQVVALTAGTGIGVTGTYPNFTVTNSAPSSGGTVTSVAALTLGTTGTDLSSTVANGTTTPVITLNVPTASAANRGALSSADWTTFNNKQAALVSGTNIKTINSTSLLGSGDIVAGLPAWVETNATDLTIWNNGKGNIVSNTSFGDGALKLNTTGTFNTAVGALVLDANTTGGRNVAVGYNALGSNTTAGQNVAIGYNALLANITGTYNAAVGYGALAQNTAGDNTAVGGSALTNNTTGSQNVAMGSATLVTNTTGGNNTALGTAALTVNTTGIQNTAVGRGSLQTLTTGSQNTAIGYNTDSPSGFSGSTILGANAAATASNQFVVGSATVNAGTVVAEINTSANVWNVIINGVARKILLA